MGADDLFVSILVFLNEVVEDVAVLGAWVLKALTPYRDVLVWEAPSISIFTRFVDELTYDRVGLTLLFGGSSGLSGAFGTGVL